MGWSIKRNLSEWLQSIWYEKKSVALFFLPLAGLFYATVVCRRFLYKAGLKKSTQLSVPVIVIGNITVGGTGKTPFTVWLANYLKQKGFRPGIISRGYGGMASSWPQQVRPDSDPRTVGDEALIISRATKCPMAVGPDRVSAARELIEHTDCNIIISDDGLQHYALARTIEIAVIDSARRLGNEYCLPAGPLREPVSRLDEVDLIVVNGVAEKDEVGMRLEGDMAVNLKDSSKTKALKAFKGELVCAVAGIGNPERFFDHLKQSGLEIKTLSFPDHHRFSKADLTIPGQAVVLMTEKDAVKCSAFTTGREWYVPVHAIVDSQVGEQIIDLVKKKESLGGI